MGLGHTTTKFVHVRGTDDAFPSIEYDEKSISFDLDNNQPLPLEEISAKSVHLLWPRDKCPLLKNDDIVFVDSPGIDVDTNFDAWIDEECADADLFILVLNAESTLMMREKAFFHQVSRKLAKPNILVLFNRWDCSDGEYDVDKVKAQHLERAAEFLAQEVHVVATAEEGKRLVFFVSAKEILRKQNAPNDRVESWKQFCEFIELCLNTTDQGCR